MVNYGDEFVQYSKPLEPGFIFDEYLGLKVKNEEMNFNVYDQIFLPTSLGLLVTAFSRTKDVKKVYPALDKMVMSMDVRYDEYLDAKDIQRQEKRTKHEQLQKWFALYFLENYAEILDFLENTKLYERVEQTIDYIKKIKDVNLFPDFEGKKLVDVAKETVLNGLKTSLYFLDLVKERQFGIFNPFINSLQNYANLGRGFYVLMLNFVLRPYAGLFQNVVPIEIKGYGKFDEVLTRYVNIAGIDDFMCQVLLLNEARMLVIHNMPYVNNKRVTYYSHVHPLALYAITNLNDGHSVLTNPTFISLVPTTPIGKHGVSYVLLQSKEQFDAKANKKDGE